MGADSGTISLVADSAYRGLRVVQLTWLTGGGVGTFEKTLGLKLAGRLLQILAAPGGTPPTAASDLAIFDGDRDASQADALVTAAGDGLDLVSTAFKKKILTVPQPICLGNLRFQITGNGVNNATGTIWLFIEEMRWKK